MYINWAVYSLTCSVLFKLVFTIIRRKFVFVAKYMTLYWPTCDNLFKKGTMLPIMQTAIQLIFSSLLNFHELLKYVFTFLHAC